jgi:plastocyanin
MAMRTPDRPRRRRHAGIVAAALAIALAGCGTGSDLTSSTSASANGQPGDTGTPGDSTVSVVMQSLDFSPLAVSAHVGQRVTWVNEDHAPHNVTYVSGPRFRSSRRRLMIGDRFSITLTQPGTIHYVCTLHPWMQATIRVSR